MAREMDLSFKAPNQDAKIDKLAAQIQAQHAKQIEEKLEGQKVTATIDTDVNFNVDKSSTEQGAEKVVEGAQEQLNKQAKKKSKKTAKSEVPVEAVPKVNKKKAEADGKKAAEEVADSVQRGQKKAKTQVASSDDEYAKELLSKDIRLKNTMKLKSRGSNTDEDDYKFLQGLQDYADGVQKRAETGIKSIKDLETFINNTRRLVKGSTAYSQKGNGQLPGGVDFSNILNEDWVTAARDTITGGGVVNVDITDSVKQFKEGLHALLSVKPDVRKANEQVQDALNDVPEQIKDWLDSNMGGSFKHLSSSEWRDTLDEYFSYAQQKYEEFEREMDKSSGILTHADYGTQEYFEADQKNTEATLGMGVFEHIRGIIGNARKLLDYIDIADEGTFDAVHTPDKIFSRIKEYRELIISMLKGMDVLPQELKDLKFLGGIRNLVGDSDLPDDEVPNGERYFQQLIENARLAKEELEEFNAERDQAEAAAEMDGAAERERQQAAEAEQAAEREREALNEKAKAQAESAQATEASIEQDKKQAEQAEQTITETKKETAALSEKQQEAKRLRDEFNANPNKGTVNAIAKDFGITSTQIKNEMANILSSSDSAEDKIQQLTEIIKENARFVQEADESYKDLAASMKAAHNISIPREDAEGALNIINGRGNQNVPSLSAFRTKLGKGFSLQGGHDTTDIERFADEAFSSAGIERSSNFEDVLVTMYDAQVTAREGIVKYGADALKALQTDVEQVKSLLREKLNVEAPTEQPVAQANPEQFIDVSDYEPFFPWEDEEKQVEQTTSAVQENTQEKKENVAVTSESVDASEQHKESLAQEEQAVAEETAATVEQTQAKKDNEQAQREQSSAEQDAATATSEATSASEKRTASLKEEEKATSEKTDADSKQATQAAETESAVSAATQAVKKQHDQNKTAVVTIKDINDALEEEQQLWGQIDQQQRDSQHTANDTIDNYSSLAEQMWKRGRSIADNGFAKNFLMGERDKVAVAKGLENAIQQSLQRLHKDSSFSDYILSQFKLDESDLQNIQAVLQPAYQRIWSAFAKSSGSKRDNKSIASQIFGFEKLANFGFKGEFDFDEIKKSIGYDSFKKNGSFVNEGKRAMADVWEMYDTIMAFVDRTQSSLTETYERLSAGAEQYHRGILSGDQSEEFQAFRKNYERDLNDASAAGVATGQAGYAYDKYLQVKNQVMDLLKREQEAEGRVLTAQERTQATLADIDYLGLEPGEVKKPSYYDEQTDDIYEYVQAEKSLQQAEDEEAESVLAGAEQVEQARKERSKFDEQLAQQKQGLDDYLAGKWDEEQEAQTQAAAAEKELQRSRQEADSSSGTDQNPEDYWSAIHLDQNKDSLASRLTYAYEKRAKQKGLKSGYEEAIQWHNPTESENKAYELAKKEIGELDELIKKLTDQYESSKKAQIAAGKEYDKQAAKAVERAEQKEKSDEQFYKGVYAEAYKIGEDRYGNVVSGGVKATRENAEELIKKYLSEQYKGITDFNFKAGKIDLSGHEGISVTFKDASGEAHKFYAALNAVKGEIRGMEGDAKALNQAYQNLFGDKPRTEGDVLDDYKKIYNTIAKIEEKKKVGLIITPNELAALDVQKENVKELDKELKKLGLNEEASKKFQKLKDDAKAAAEKRWQTAYSTKGEKQLGSMYDDLVASYSKIQELEAKQTYGILSVKDQNVLTAAREKYQDILETLEEIRKIAPQALLSKDTELKQDADAKMSGIKGRFLAEEAAKQQKKYGSVYATNVTRGNVVDAVTQNIKGKLTDEVKVQDIGNGLFKVTAAYKTADGVVTKFNGTLNTTSGELRAIETVGAKSATALSQQMSMVKADFMKVAGIFSRYLSGYQMAGYIKQQVSTVREIDSQFVELRKVSEDSTRSLEAFREKSFDLGRTVGQTSVDILNAAAQWEQLGYNIKEAESLVQASVVFKNVADGMQDEQEATEDLISAMKAFHIEAEGAMDIVDALNEVSNNYSVSAQDLGKILKRSSATLAVGGNTMEQTLALGTAMNEIMQEAGTSGNALKILSLRLRGQKTEIADAGEDTEGMVESTSKLQEKIKALTGGFDIMADASNFKSTYEIMKGIADVWDDLTDINRAALLELIAGKNRANAVASLLSNFEQVDKVINTIENDEGSATRENLIRLDSINGRITLLKNSIQELSQTAVDSNFLKVMISDLTKLTNGLTDFIKAVDNIKLPFTDKSVSGIMPMMAQMGGLRFGFKQGKSLFGLGNNPDAIVNLGRSRFGNAQFKNAFGQDFMEFANGIDAARMQKPDFKLDEYLSAFRGNGKGLDPELINRIKDMDETAGHAGQTLGQMAANVNGLDSYLASGTMTLMQFAKGLKQAAVTSAQFLAISIALQAVVSVVDEAIHHQERLNASFAEHSNNLRESNEELSQYRSRIQELNKVINDQKSSVSDVVSARQELSQIQSEMIEAYGKESNSIEYINQLINGTADAYDKLAAAQYRAAKSSLITSNNGVKENIVRFFKGEASAFTELVDNFEHYDVDIDEFKDYLPQDGKGVKIVPKQAVAGINDLPTTTDTGSYHTAGTIYDALELFDEIQKGLDEALATEKITQREYEKRIAHLDVLRANADSTKESGEYLYQGHIVEDVIKTDDALAKQYKLLQKIGEEYDSFAKNNDQEGMDNAISEYAQTLNAVLAKGLSDGELNAFKDIYPLLYAEAQSWTFETNFKANEDGLKHNIEDIIQQLNGALGHSVSAEELLNWNKSQHSGYQNQLVSNLGAIGKDAGFDSFSSFVTDLQGVGAVPDQYVQQFYDSIKKRIPGVAEDIISSLNKSEIAALSNFKGAVDTFEQYYSEGLDKFKDDTKKAAEYAANQTVVAARKAGQSAKKELDLSAFDYSKMASDLERLSKISTDLKNGGNFNWNNLGDDFKKAFGDIDDSTGQFGNAYKEFFEVISTAPNDAEKCKQAFDNLAGAYIYNSELLEGLTEDNKEAVISMLGSQGIANAADIVADKMKLNAQAKEVEAAMTQTLEGKTYSLANASLAEANAELTKGNYSSFAAQQIAKLYLEEQRVNGITINTQADIDNLAALAGQARLTQGELQALMSAINVSSNFQVQGINALSDSARQARLESDGVVGSIDNMMNTKDPHAIVEMQLKNALQPQKIQKQVRDSIRDAAQKARDAAAKDAEKLTIPDYVGGQSTSGGGGGGGGGNGSDSQTDKEFDWISRYIEMKQRKNDELREVIDDQYTVYQNSIKQDEDYLKAQQRLAEAEKKLEELGIDPTNYTPTPADGMVHPREDTGEYPAGWVSDGDDIPQWLKDANVGGDMFDAAGESAEDAAKSISKATANTDEAYNEYVAAKEALEAYGEARVVGEKSQLDTIKELIQSDQDLIDSQQAVLDGYKTQWAEYQQQIADQWGDKAPQWIQDIIEGNVSPEDWEAVYTYKSSDQAEKDRVESLDRGKEAYDSMLSAEDELRKKIKQKLIDEQKEYEIRLNIVKAQQAQIKNLADTAQWELDMKGVLGEVVQESDYQQLIDINDDLIANYEEQLDILHEQLGTLNEGEQAWYDCQSSIYECENAIREARKQQAEWNDIILRLPVENMQRFLKLLQNIGKDLENFMAIQEAMGKDTTVDQIGKQWEDALDQITADQGGFNAQAEKWLDILENYDLGSDKFSEVDDAIQECEDSVTSLIESMVELNSQLLNLPIDRIAEMTEYLNGTLSDLQSVQSEFETAINSVINAITDEQDRLQKEYDDLEESINDQIKPLEEALDQLEKQNDQRSRQLAIEKAQLELAKQQEQHTLQVIRNGQVQYESDQSAIRDAQEGLADAEYNKLIGDLNDQIDALNDQLDKASDKLDDAVKSLQNMLDERWETIMPDTETARNEEIATRIFGEGWKELVLAGKNSNGVYADEAIYQAMRRAYEENSEQQRDVDNQIKTNELITTTLQKYVEDFQAEKMTAEEMSQKISTLMNIVSDSLVTGQEALRNTLTMGGYETLGNALGAANTLRENQLDVFNENLQIAQERRDQIDDLTLDWEEFARKFDEYRDQLKADWDTIDFIGEKVSVIQDNSDDDDDGDYTQSWGATANDGYIYTGETSHISTDAAKPYADGLAKGQVGRLSTSEKFKAIQALGLKKLEPDEIPAILHAGEGVINGRQQSNILSNMNGALSLGAGNKLGAMVNISMGDLTLPNVTNGKEFAESLAQNFTPIMNQYFSKVFSK